MKKIIILFFCTLLLRGLTQNITAQSIAWTEVAPGIWKSVVGNPDKLNLLNAADIKPFMTGLEKMGTQSFPLVQDNEIFR